MWRRQHGENHFHNTMCNKYTNEFCSQHTDLVKLKVYISQTKKILTSIKWRK